jgi:hypothetical protein
VQFVFDNRCLIAIGVNCTGAAVEPRSSTQLRYDVFAIQDEIAETIAAALEPQIYAVETLTTEKSTQQPRDATGTEADNRAALAKGEKGILKIAAEFGVGSGTINAEARRFLTGNLDAWWALALIGVPSLTLALRKPVLWERPGPSRLHLGCRHLFDAACDLGNVIHGHARRNLSAV